MDLPTAESLMNMLKIRKLSSAGNSKNCKEKIPIITQYNGIHRKIERKWRYFFILMYKPKMRKFANCMQSSMTQIL